MQRSSIIATVIAAGGVLIAGSVASVAVINAASSNQPGSETIQLVATGSSATPSPEDVSAALAPTPSAAATLPPVEQSALPELPEVTQPAEQAATAAPVRSGTSTSGPTSTKEASDDSKQPSPATPAATVSASQARSVVLKQGDGVSVVSTTRESHQGYRTWAVRITRANGEELTGYVDRASGVVVDWTVNKAATPAAQPSPSASDDDREDVDPEDVEREDVEREDNSGSGSDDEAGEDD